MRKMRTPRRARWIVAVVLVLVALFAVGCVGTGVDSFEEFEGSIEGGASCSELFDQRANFEDPKDLEKVDEAMDEVGCASRDSERSDS